MIPEAPLPSHVPVMVVPGATLFPRSLLPLRIFETRFRKMLEAALETDRLFALAMPEDPAETSLRPIAGLGLIRMSVTRPDGTSEVLLQGLQRVRFAEWTQLQPFRIAAILPYGEQTNETLQDREKRRGALLDSIKDKSLQLPMPLLQSFGKEPDPDHLVDMIAATLLRDQPYRQAILEEPNPIRRHHKLLEFIRSAD